MPKTGRALLKIAHLFEHDGKADCVDIKTSKVPFRD